MTDAKLNSSVRSMKRLHNDWREKLRIARSILLELSTWHSALPSFNPSSHQISNNQDTSIDNSASLELGYHTIQLTIFRALLKGFGSDTSTPQERESSEWKEAHDHCRTAAKTTIMAAHHFASSLGTIHSQSFWPPCKLPFVRSRFRVSDSLLQGQVPDSQ